MSQRSLFKGKKLDRDGGLLSNSSSRNQSRSRTPMRSDDSDYESDYDENELLKIEEILREKLTALNTQDMGEVGKEDRISSKDRRQFEAHQLNNKRIQENSNIKDIITSLTFSRSDISSQSRELLLTQLYKIIISKPLVIYNEENIGNKLNYVDEETVSILINQFTNSNYRSELEFLYLFKSVIALICSDIEEFGVLISNDFLSHIQQLIQGPVNSIVTSENKSNIIIGYTTLTLILYNDSSSFGIDDKVSLLMEIAEGYSASATTLQKQIESGDREHATFITDKNLDKRLVNEATSKVLAEASVATSALNGVGCLLTLMKKGSYLNEIMEDLMIRLVPLLDNDENRDIAKAAGKVIALIYELYDYGVEKVESNGNEEEDEEYNLNAPYYEQETLCSILTRLLNLSSKKVSKKDKKEISSVFRNILNTIRIYTNNTEREQVYKGTKEGVELSQQIMDSSYIKLSKYRIIKVNSWYLYIRLRHLKWLFSFGLHSQLVNNESVRDVLKSPENEYSYGSSLTQDYEYFDDDDESSNQYHHTLNSINDKQRSSKRKKERVAKLDEQLEELNLNV
ncbi:uncharacterized protein KGF55_004924 [Candida pseudojiufengensis]|uniref:uncharacterized protein n=1 Tax=Candida pseudojiufengensis TaxID=497109 RepID=UPI002224E5FE|nr:uncharacterized protein KGF55_004924 [Candida pseudojiufengensis]KAI5960201.1 hypothetical protein KGF55_004924 [Candida pseudojiufengensis]